MVATRSESGDSVDVSGSHRMKMSRFDGPTMGYKLRGGTSASRHQHLGGPWRSRRGASHRDQ